MDFFREFNLTRGVIVISLLASIWLGFQVKERYELMQRLDARLEMDAGMLATEIQRGSQRLQQLIDASSREGFKSQANPDTYLRAQAADPMANLGDINITKRETDVNGVSGLVDKIWTLKPQDNKSRFARQDIANYMQLLEERSRRVKVTHVNLKQVDNKRNHEYSDDYGWTFSIDVTSRQAVEER